MITTALVLAYVATFALGLGLARAAGRAAPLATDACSWCSHSRAWHEHNHERTYCADRDCNCERFTDR